MYTTLAEADEYWLSRGGSEWADADAETREAALVKATEWIDTSFNWIGRIASNDQLLSWPRIARDKEGRVITGIPEQLKHAVAWLAGQALIGELDPAQDRGGDIQIVKAGSVQINWNKNAPTGKSFRHVKRMLRNLTTGTQLRRG